VLLALWIPHELRAEEPLVDLRQVKNRSVLMADVAGFLICVSMYLFLPVLVEFVQIPAVSGYGFGASVVVAGSCSSRSRSAPSSRAASSPPSRTASARAR